MCRTLRQLDVLLLMCQLIKKCGTQEMAAKEIGVSPQFFNDVYLERKLPTGKILAYFGLEKRIIYVETKGDD